MIDKQDQGCLSRGESGVCCLKLKSPSIILRNLIVPEDMWDVFPKGLGLSVTDYFLYQPHFPIRATTVSNPSTFGMDYEEVFLTTSDNIRLHAYLIKHRSMSPLLPTIIFFHGNAGDIGDRLENANLLHRSLPVHVFLVEYRGYGISQGEPSEKGLYKDSIAAYRYVEQRTDLNPRRIIIFGRSLGGAVAIDLGARKEFRNKVGGIIIENTFTSIPGMAQSLFPFRAIKYLPRFFYSNKYENEKKVSKLKCPALFVSGCFDEIIPSGMMESLYNACSSVEKKVVTFASGHNDTWCAPGYLLALNDFITRCMQLTEIVDPLFPTPTNGSKITENLNFVPGNCPMSELNENKALLLQKSESSLDSYQSELNVHQNQETITKLETDDNTVPSTATNINASSRQQKASSSLIEMSNILESLDENANTSSRTNEGTVICTT